MYILKMVIFDIYVSLPHGNLYPEGPQFNWSLMQLGMMDVKNQAILVARSHWKNQYTNHQSWIGMDKATYPSPDFRWCIDPSHAVIRFFCSPSLRLRWPLETGWVMWLESSSGYWTQVLEGSAYWGVPTCQYMLHMCIYIYIYMIWMLDAFI